MPSLVNLLFEQSDGSESTKDGAKILKKSMPPLKVGPTEILKFLDGPGADPKVRAALDAGDKDGDPEDEKSAPKSTAAEVGKLIPTQIEIELGKSISYPLSKFKSYKSMISGGVQKIGPPDNDHIVINGNLIIDGHHRWSGLFAVTGPIGKIAAYDLGIKFKDAASVLAAAQVGIAASLKDGQPIPRSKAGGKNILGKSKDEIKSMIESSVGEETEAGVILSDDFVKNCMADTEVAKHIGIKPNMKLEEARSVIIEKTAENLSKMKLPADGAPPRVDMPQLDKASGGAKEVIKDFQDGNINYKEPFGENRKNEDAIMIERWSRLAGILKD